MFSHQSTFSKPRISETCRLSCITHNSTQERIFKRSPSLATLARRSMISLCLRCHAKVGRTKCVLSEMPPLLLLLWREQHPDGHEQVMIDFTVLEKPAEPVALFPEENGLKIVPAV